MSKKYYVYILGVFPWYSTLRKFSFNIWLFKLHVNTHTDLSSYILYLREEYLLEGMSRYMQLYNILVQVY